MASNLIATCRTFFAFGSQSLNVGEGQSLLAAEAWRFKERLLPTLRTLMSASANYLTAEALMQPTWRHFLHQTKKHEVFVVGRPLLVGILSCKDTEGRTACMWAARHGHLSMVTRQVLRLSRSFCVPSVLLLALGGGIAFMLLVHKQFLLSPVKKAISCLA